MGKKVGPSVCLFTLLALLAAAVSHTAASKARGPGGAAPLGGAGLAERIRRVENGLGPPVQIKGRRADPATLSERMRFYKVPGVSVAVINDWALEWARAYGVKESGRDEPVTTETLFQAASISKPVTAVAALRLVESGKLSLDDDVNRALTSWKVPDSEFTKEKKVTLRRLLSHSSGISEPSVGTYTAGQKIPTLLEILGGDAESKTKALQVSFTPGSRWEYSGGGYTVVQQLLSDAAGEPFPDLMRELVIDPLGMRHSSFEQPFSRELAGFAASGHNSEGAVYEGRWHVFPEMAAAGLWSTPSDLALFAVELQKSAAGRSDKLLSAGMTRQMLTRQIKNWGLGFDVEGEGASASFNHSGWNDGYRSYLVAFTGTGQGAVVMTNGDSSSGAKLIKEIVRSIADEYGWPDYRSKERALAKIDPRVYEAYAGQYRAAGGLTFDVTTEGGRLYVLALPLGRGKVELYPESAESFFVTVDDVVFTFVKGGGGAAAELIVRPPDQTITAKRVK